MLKRSVFNTNPAIVTIFLQLHPSMTSTEFRKKGLTLLSWTSVLLFPVNRLSISSTVNTVIIYIKISLSVLVAAIFIANSHTIKNKALSCWVVVHIF
jgi:hypothetical protein